MNLDNASYKVEDGEGLRRVLHVQVPAEAIQREFLARLGAIRRRSRIRGFRPGKAPIKLIRRHYGQDVWNEVISETIEQSFRAGAQDRKLRVIGGSEVKTRQAREGAALEYEATFDILPDIEWNGLDRLTYEQPEVEVQSRDVERTINRLRRRQGEWKDATRPSRDGDLMVVNLRASRRRQTLEAGERRDEPLILGETRLMPQLAERLTGLSAAQKKRFRLKMPPDFPEPSLRGKRVLYEVEVLNVAEPALLDLDEEFIQMLGVESGLIEDLRADVREMMERELKSTREDHKRRALFDQLLAFNPGPTPQSMVEQGLVQAPAETDDGDQSEETPDQSEETPDQSEETPGQSEETPGLRAASERRVRMQLLISELAAREEITPDEQALRERLRMLAARAPDPEATFAKLAGDRELVGNLRTRLSEEQVLEWLYEKAAVTTRAMRFDEFMEPMPPVLSG